MRFRSSSHVLSVSLLIAGLAAGCGDGDRPGGGVGGPSGGATASVKLDPQTAKAVAAIEAAIDELMAKVPADQKSKLHEAMLGMRAGMGDMAEFMGTPLTESDITTLLKVFPKMKEAGDIPEARGESKSLADIVKALEANAAMRQVIADTGMGTEEFAKKMMAMVAAAGFAGMIDEQGGLDKVASGIKEMAEKLGELPTDKAKMTPDQGFAMMGVMMTVPMTQMLVTMVRSCPPENLKLVRAHKAEIDKAMESTPDGSTEPPTMPDEMPKMPDMPGTPND
jgi:hypothetical protein